MRKIIISISLVVFAISMIVYVTGCIIFSYLISDDTGDWFLWTGGIALFILLLRARGIQPEIRLVINILCGCVIFFCTAFGLWGLVTTEGREQFEGMGALVPFYALLTAGGIILMLIVANIIWRGRRN
jgi:hypothetical protein